MSGTPNDIAAAVNNGKCFPKPKLDVRSWRRAAVRKLKGLPSLAIDARDARINLVLQGKHLRIVAFAVDRHGRQFDRAPDEAARCWNYSRARVISLRYEQIPHVASILGIARERPEIVCGRKRVAQRIKFPRVATAKGSVASGPNRNRCLD